MLNDIYIHNALFFKFNLKINFFIQIHMTLICTLICNDKALTYTVCKMGEVVSYYYWQGDVRIQSKFN